MQNVSSQWTLFYKMVVPTLWIVFFGTICLFLIFSEHGDLFYSWPTWANRGLILLFFLSGVWLLYYFFIRLKRVEMDEEHLYVTNYFQVYRYPFSDIEKVEENKFLFFRPVSIYLRKSGSFGKKFTFLASEQFQAYMETHPEIARQLLTTNE